MNSISDILREDEEASDRRHNSEIDAVYAQLRDTDKEIAYLKEKIWELEAELVKA